MNFYYRSLPEGRCEVVCTRCFVTIGAASDIKEIRQLEDDHCCQAERRPRAAATSVRRPPAERDDAGYFRLLRVLILLSAATLCLYVLPTIFEFTALRDWNPWFSVLLPGDLAGCACLVVVYRKPKAGAVLYCLLTAVEACFYRLHITPLNVLPWIVDLVPTAVVCGTILFSRGPHAKVQILT